MLTRAWWSRVLWGQKPPKPVLSIYDQLATAMPLPELDADISLSRSVVRAHLDYLYGEAA